MSRFKNDTEYKDEENDIDEDPAPCLSREDDGEDDIDKNRGEKNRVTLFPPHSPQGLGLFP